jgi:hypothetical protein
MFGVKKESAESSGNFQVRMGVGRKQRWDDVCRARRLTYTRAMNSLVDWWLAQDPNVQLMITGNLPPDAETFAELVKLGIEYDESIVDPRGIEEVREEVAKAEADRRAAAGAKAPSRVAAVPRAAGHRNRAGGA